MCLPQKAHGGPGNLLASCPNLPVGYRSLHLIGMHAPEAFQASFWSRSCQPPASQTRKSRTNGGIPPVQSSLSAQVRSLR
jgi:hypothetical protein